MAETRMERAPFKFPLRECGAIVLISVSVFIGLALFSYVPVDFLEGEIRESPNNQNLVGQIGVIFVTTAGMMFGWAALLLPFTFATLAFRIGKRTYVNWTWFRAIVSTFSFLIFLSAGSILAELHLSSTYADFSQPGGWVGELAVNWFIATLGTVGLTIVAGMFFILGVQLFLFFSWLRFFQQIVRIVRGMGKILLLVSDTANTTTVGVFTFPARVYYWFKRTFTRKKKKSKRVEPIRPERIQPTEIVSTDVEEPITSNDNPFVPQKSGTTRPKRRTASKARKRVKAEHKQPVVPTSVALEANSYVLPSLDLLDPPILNKENDKARIKELRDLGSQLQNHLSDFGVLATVVGIVPGPVVTRFELELASGVKVQKISGLVKDIARMLAVTSVRVVPIIPGKSVIGVEIPNERRKIVTFREVIDDDQFVGSQSPLTFALGVNVAGTPMCADIERMPHLLVAGTTGSGKSVAINVMLLSLLFRVTPEDLRLVLIDPKMLELSVYEDIPHLLTPVVTDVEDSVKVMTWCVAEMERRYRILSHANVRNLSGYNAKIEATEAAGNPLYMPSENGLELEDEAQEPLKQMPRILIVVDEFADLVMMVGKKVEDLIVRIAQKARAAGIHLVLATQRPSANVITSLIKSNIPVRMSFQVSSQVDSRVILDQGGAEQLLGRGDMLYMPPGSSVPERIHGAFVSDDEVLSVVQRLVANSSPDYDESVLSESMQSADSGSSQVSNGYQEDPLYSDAVRVVYESEKASISNVQRRLNVGYNRAANLIERMEEEGIVSPPKKNGSRQILRNG
ncbi:MAG: DNA translocase FtsK 4TM domain-containing protein [Gammaproteobacteria bacterium]|nr:DNA translocase FtsK 4TM domain-containing protein [Gammaproteobacteria bacterium]